MDRRRDPHSHPGSPAYRIVVLTLCLAGGVPGHAVAADDGGAPARRAIRLSDLVPALTQAVPAQARSEAGFAAFVRSLDEETARRERSGEYEHLVYYLLQSTRFTTQPRIEPALSAYELVEGMGAEERSRFLNEAETPTVRAVPTAVVRRAEDFVKALAGRPADPRLALFKRFLDADARPAPHLDRLLSEYARAMRFLYRKEFLSRDLEDRQALEAYLASLYRKRGHSTDTQVEANFAVHTALSVIRARGEARIDNVLIVGPGLDFAPRTDLLDAFEPQSYQPFAVVDALLGLGLSDPLRLRVHCVDINDRVVDYFRGLRGERSTPLRLLSGIAEREGRPFTPEYREYFRRLGRNIGQEAALALPREAAGRLGKTVEVRAEIARRITADGLNIVTQRYDPEPGYDLVVVTNVFSYFDPAEQALALSNIAAMLRDGGYLVHNEPQSSLIAAAERVGMAMTDARTVLLAAHHEAPLFDRVVIHRKALPSGRAAGNAARTK